MQLVTEAKVTGIRALVRVGFDVPTLPNGQITDTLRITEALPTINYLLENQAKIILLSHRGRPNGYTNPQYSLLPVAAYLESILKTKVGFIAENSAAKIGLTLNTLKSGEVVMLENLRFYPGEEKNDPQFCKWLATLGEIYVNDAFSDCHRSHASIVGLPKLLPHYAGLSLEKEVTNLTKLLTNPTHPVVAIIGGAKLESKLPVIKNLVPIVDYLLTGSKFIEEDLPDSPKLVLPVDVCKDNTDLALDIGEETINNYVEIIKGAKTIFWSGPLGVFENKDFQEGTRKVGEAVVSSGATTIIGGGDTIAAFTKFNLLDKVSFVSTGGSAMLAFVAGKKLPGLEALND